MDDLQTSINAFLQTDPYNIVIDENIENSRKDLKVKLVKEIPDRLSDVAADAIDSLRSALDQAGYATAVASGRTNPRSTHFPFGRTVSDLEKQVKNKSSDIPVPILDIMLNFKPYEGGNGLLWAMNTARNANQHKILTPIVTASPGLKIEHIKSKRGKSAVYAPIWDENKNELILYSYDLDAEVEYEFNVSLTLVFTGIEGISGVPVIPFLSALALEVENILNAIEAGAQRMGIVT